MQYYERVTPPGYVMILLSALAASFGLIFVPLSSGLALAIALTLGVVAGVLQWAASPQIEVKDGWLRAGPAHIHGSFLADVTTLDRPAVRHLMGPGADARAFSVHRDYIAAGVQVQLSDQRDPAPYWLISTARPAELAAAIRAIANQD